MLAVVLELLVVAGAKLIVSAEISCGVLVVVVVVVCAGSPLTPPCVGMSRSVDVDGGGGWVVLLTGFGSSTATFCLLANLTLEPDMTTARALSNGASAISRVMLAMKSS